MNWLEYHEEPVTLHSGGKSHWLVRGDLIFADKQLREAVLSYWLKILYSWAPPLEIISVPTGGDKWAEALRERIPPPHSEHIDNTPFKIIVDDVVTTGASISKEIAHVRLAVVDRRVSDYDPFYIASWAKIRLPLL